MGLISLSCAAQPNCLHFVLSPASHLSPPHPIVHLPSSNQAVRKGSSRRLRRRRLVRPQIFTELPLRSRPAQQRGGRNGQVSQQHPLCTPERRSICSPWCLWYLQLVFQQHGWP
ncbi:hypothetical protein VPH35_036557 [Triticum aestivum]